MGAHSLCTVVTVNLPDEIFLSCFKGRQEFKTQHWTELLRFGIFAALADVLKKKRRDFFFSGSIISWLFFPYHQVTLTGNRHVVLWIYEYGDVTVTRRTIIWPTAAPLEGERIVSVFSSAPS